MSTLISWSDETWNPTTGCTMVSRGCKNCYAQQLTERFAGQRGWPAEFLPWTPANEDNNVILHRDRLDAPLKMSRPRRIFVDSMSDLFHAKIPDEFRREVFATMWLAERHTFQILTKRIDEALAFLQKYQRDGKFVKNLWPLPNVIIGPTIEDQRQADRRLPVLAQIKALGWRTMVSYEPALGPVDFRPWLGEKPLQGAVWQDCVCGEIAITDRPCMVCVARGNAIDWLICGGESGAQRRPFLNLWAVNTMIECRQRGIPFFMKQLGGLRPGTALEDLPEVLRVREFPS